MKEITSCFALKKQGPLDLENLNITQTTPPKGQETERKVTARAAQTDFLGMFRLVLLQNWKCAISVEIKFWYQMMIHPCITGCTDSQSHIHCLRFRY